MEKNLLVVQDVEEANKIDLDFYYYDRYSETRDAFIYVKRMKKR